MNPREFLEEYYRLRREADRADRELRWFLIQHLGSGPITEKSLNAFIIHLRALLEKEAEG